MEESIVWTRNEEDISKYEDKINKCNIDEYFESDEKYRNIETTIDDIQKYASYQKLHKRQKIDISNKCEVIKRHIYDDVDEWHNTCELLNAKLIESEETIKKMTAVNNELRLENTKLNTENRELHFELLDNTIFIIENERLAREKTQLENSNNQLKKLIFKLENENTTLHNKINTMVGDATFLKNETNNVRNKLDILIDENELLRDEVQDLKDALLTHVNENISLKKKYGL